MWLTIGLWVIRAGLALFFVPAGLYKLTFSKRRLAPNFPWVEGFSSVQIKLIALADLAGGLGVVLPVLTGIAPWLSAVAAAGIVALMLTASALHHKRGESVGLQIGIALIAAALFAFSLA